MRSYPLNKWQKIEVIQSINVRHAKKPDHENLAPRY